MSYYIRKNGVTKKLVVIPEGYPAEFIGYDNTGTNLQSDNAQDAITELDSGKVSDNPTFTEAQTRANISSGETFATILGKIKKWFTDLPSMFVSKTDGGTFGGNVTVDEADGTSSAEGFSYLTLGNSTPENRDGNSTGILRLFSATYYCGDLKFTGLTNNRTVEFPNKSGTVALTDDVDTKLDASKINFSAGTFAGDVLDAAKTMNDGSIAFYSSSNNPANCPTDCKWGAYMFIKTGGKTMIIYMDNNHTATAYGIDSTHTSITWHIS